MESYGEHVYGKDRTEEMLSRLERIERMQNVFELLRRSVAQSSAKIKEDVL